ncbi:MAG: TIM44-like domain-containing protein [Rubrivivax sp.]|nr:TIM44-like domain-containing protein [Rubrivivax sp.]
MKTWWIGALAAAVFVTAIPTDADARRFGGGKSSGFQRDMPARTAPDAPPPRPASPTNPANPGQQAAPAAAPAAAGAAAAAQRRSWMGPIAGLAAGLGLAALASYLGFGEAFANFLMLALLAIAAVFLIRFVMRRMAGGGAQQPAMAGAGAANSARTPWTPPAAAPREDSAPRGAWAPPAQAEPPQTVVLPQPTADAPAKAFVPASFDSEGFARIAKSIFIRLQAANDTADLEDLRRFTTPELFAEVRLQLQERGSAPQHTDVQEVNAEVLDVADDGQQQIVSVRFTGRIVEEQDGPANAFDEVWHLVKPHDDSRSWAIAGIEQMG